MKLMWQTVTTNLARGTYFLEYCRHCEVTILLKLQASQLISVFPTKSNYSCKYGIKI